MLKGLKGLLGKKFAALFTVGTAALNVAGCVYGCPGDDTELVADPNCCTKYSEMDTKFYGELCMHAQCYGQRRISCAGEDAPESRVCACDETNINIDEAIANVEKCCSDIMEDKSASMNEETAFGKCATNVYVNMTNSVSNVCENTK